MTAPITKDAQNDINSTPRSTTLAMALQLGHSCAGSASDRRCGSKPSLWALFLNYKRKENTVTKCNGKQKKKSRKFWFGIRKRKHQAIKLVHYSKSFGFLSVNNPWPSLGCIGFQFQHASVVNWNEDIATRCLQRFVQFGRKQNGSVL